MGTESAAAQKRRTPGAPSRSARASIPLSALRERLDAGSARANWSIDVEGVPGRALVQYAG
ncbi:MAG: hypothetical protein ACLP8S_18270, partial [Solirubrobacteraceae bacterium]